MAPDIGRVTLLLRRILTVTLVVALVTMGVPIPGYASGGQEQTFMQAHMGPAKSVYS